MKKSLVTVIGLGKVGKAFLNVLPGKGYNIVSTFTRTVSGLKPGAYPKEGLPQSEDELGELVFITVPDGAIETVSEQIAENVDDLSGKIFAHCSGTLGSAVLKAVQRKGADIASFHPMMSVTPSTRSFENTWFDLEGDEAALSSLRELADDIGACSFRIDAESKMYLHASAVVASNYLVALAEIAARIAKAGDISRQEALQSLLPLMQSTLKNLGERGIEDALTGPIARTDTGIIKKHLELLEKEEKLVEIYKQLGLFTADVAGRTSADSGALEEIKKLLS